MNSATASRSSFLSQGIDTYGDQYTLDGHELEARHSTGLVATMRSPALQLRVRRRKDLCRPSGMRRFPAENSGTTTACSI